MVRARDHAGLNVLNPALRRSAANLGAITPWCDVSPKAMNKGMLSQIEGQHARLGGAANFKGHHAPTTRIGSRSTPLTPLLGLELAQILLTSRSRQLNEHLA